MKFRNPFGQEHAKKIPEAVERTKEPSTEDDEAVLTRRQFLVGAGTLIASVALPKQEAKAYAGESYEVLHSTQEEREENEEVLTAYAQWIKENQTKLADPDVTSRQKLKIMVHDLPGLERSMLEGTRFDHEEKFRKVFTDGSWPAVRVKEKVSGGKRALNYAHEGHLNMTPFRYGNAFFVDGMLVSNRHVIDESFVCELINPESKDIAACSLNDLDPAIKEAQHLKGSDTARVMLDWDRRRSAEDLHGKIVHIPNIHQERGADDLDKTDITSGVMIKISPDMPRSLENGNGIIKALGKEHEMVKDFTETMKNSYLVIIGKRDSNNDGTSNSNDFTGVSGSPVFTDEDCAEGRKIPSGIVWGVAGITILDEKTGKRLHYTIALIHGSDVIGEMIDKTNTISSHIDSADVPYKKALTTKVQERLVELGYSITVDGDYGAETQTAVGLFQRSVFDEETLQSRVIPTAVDRRTWDELFPNEAGISKQELYDSLGR